MTHHHVEVRVSRPTFYRNVRYMRQLVSPAKLCVVMKANAYGHGLEALLPAAIEGGADVIGICTNPEAAAIRRNGFHTIPLLRLRMALPAELEESVASLNIQEQVGDEEVAEQLSAAGVRRGRPVEVHLKIDTGMGRCGFYPESVETLRQILKLPGLKVVGMMTHFPSADGAELEQTVEQLAAFDALHAQLADALPADVMVHTHNSAATVRLPKARASMVRVGAACYGVRTSTEFDNPAALEPVMSFRSWVAQVREIPKGRTIGYGSLFETKRDSRIAALPVGFGEGYPRGLFNKGIVLIKGQRCPVVGRVSLNVTTVDVTDVEQPVNIGDEAVLIGRQGGERVTFEEMADKFASVHTEINLMAGFMNPIQYV
jgi:alanine racemase